MPRWPAPSGPVPARVGQSEEPFTPKEEVPGSLPRAGSSSINLLPTATCRAADPLGSDHERVRRRDLALLVGSPPGRCRSCVFGSFSRGVSDQGVLYSLPKALTPGLRCDLDHGGISHWRMGRRLGVGRTGGRSV